MTDETTGNESKTKDTKPATGTPPVELKDEVVQSEHSIVIDGATVRYTATAGRLVMKTEEGKAKAAVFFVAGFTTVFVGLGAGASAFGQLIQTYRGPLSSAAGVIIILFGLHFLGLLRINMLYKEARVSGPSETAIAAS